MDNGSVVPRRFIVVDEIASVKPLLLNRPSVKPLLLNRLKCCEMND
jgi:hypothetical protein